MMAVMAMANSSSEYWKKRERENLQKNLKSEVEYAKQIEQTYKYTMDQIQREIDSFYAKYARDEGITIAQAKKRASQLDMEEYSRKAKKYVKEKNFSKQANEEMKLYNLTMKVNRLELLKANIGLELVSCFDELQRFYEQKLTDRTMDEFERQAGILGSTVPDDVAGKAAAIVTASFHNATYSQRIWAHQDLLRNELGRLLINGLIQGKNPRALARELRKTFQASIFNSERLLWTELARVQTAAQMQSYKDNGFDEYEYLTARDFKVCASCKALDGKIFKVDDAETGTNSPPMHPCCRCSTTAHMDLGAYEKWLDGYSKHGMSFKEWQKNGSKPKKATKPKVYKKLTKDEFKAIKQSITKAERSIIYGKTHFSGYVNSSNARKLNALLREGKQLPADYKNVAETLRSVIGRHKLPDDMIVTRYVGMDALEGMFDFKMPQARLDQSVDEFWKQIDGLPGKIGSGKIYTEKGFLSTSGVADQNVMTDKIIKMVIKAPKGTHSYVTNNYKESEIIFGENTSLHFTRAYIENPRQAGWKLVLECEIR